MVATKKKPPTKKRKAAKPEVSPRERYLLVLIAASERAISIHNSSVDQFFRDQVEKLKGELKQLKSAK